jgi:hypothetical protein
MNEIISEIVSSNVFKPTVIVKSYHDNMTFISSECTFEGEDKDNLMRIYCAIECRLGLPVVVGNEEGIANVKSRLLIYYTLRDLEYDKEHVLRNPRIDTCLCTLESTTLESDYSLDDLAHGAEDVLMDDLKEEFLSNDKLTITLQTKG